MDCGDYSLNHIIEMKKETLKDWIEDWSISDIIDNVFSTGMSFMVETEGMKTNKDVAKYKKIIINEIKERLK